MPSLDMQRCPLCHQPNACAMAAGLPAAGCWCMAAPVARAALARLPQEQRGQRCICPHCAREVPDAAADKIPPFSPVQEPTSCPPTTSK